MSFTVSSYLGPSEGENATLDNWKKICGYYKLLVYFIPNSLSADNNEANRLPAVLVTGSLSQISMMVDNALLYMWCQAICKYHDDIGHVSSYQDCPNLMIHISRHNIDLFWLEYNISSCTPQELIAFGNVSVSLGKSLFNFIWIFNFSVDL